MTNILRAEHLNRHLVLASRWGKRGLPYPIPCPAKKPGNITLYWPICRCRFSRFCFLSKTLFRLKIRLGLGWVLGLGSGSELGFRVRLRNQLPKWHSIGSTISRTYTGTVYVPARGHTDGACLHAGTVSGHAVLSNVQFFVRMWFSRSGYRPFITPPPALWN